MSAFSSEARFFGVDVGALARDTRAAWQNAQKWPIFSWLTPSLPVRLLEVNGTESICHGGRICAPYATSKSTNKDDCFLAIELPEDLILSRVLHLPSVAAQVDWDSALALYVQTLSPFPEDDLVWVSESRQAASDSEGIEVFFASRKQVEKFLLGLVLPVNAKSETPEVWIRTDKKNFLVLPGFGDGRREALARRQRNWNYGLVFIALCLLAAMVVTPTLQLRERALQVSAAYESMVHKTEPIVRQREQVVQLSAKLQGLAEILGDRVEPLILIDTLTQILPDDTAVQGMQLAGTKVTVTGHTTDTGALMQKLGQHPGIRDVRAPSPATRINGAVKENFSVEFVVNPAVFNARGQAGGSAGLPAAASVSPQEGGEGRS